mmetsp:Transcript_8299/g.51673  ORF Transcript_8299/g.51673 Transcript_8299/m.51673 type:complete len:282 (-) Transcript_8299:1339-2184(-)
MHRDQLQARRLTACTAKGFGVLTPIFPRIFSMARTMSSLAFIDILRPSPTRYRGSPSLCSSDSGRRGSKSHAKRQSAATNALILPTNHLVSSIAYSSNAWSTPPHRSELELAICSFTQAAARYLAKGSLAERARNILERAGSSLGHRSPNSMRSTATASSGSQSSRGMSTSSKGRRPPPPSPSSAKLRIAWMGAKTSRNFFLALPLAFICFFDFRIELPWSCSFWSKESNTSLGKSTTDSLRLWMAFSASLRDIGPIFKSLLIAGHRRKTSKLSPVLPPKQ